jgi:hypothetical protein
MNSRQKLFSVCALALLTQAAFAATPGSGFTVLAGTAVTCTDSAITGDVGVSPGTAITQTHCTISGQVHAGDGVAQQAYNQFLASYESLASRPCDFVIAGNLAGVTLDRPGVYCVDAASTTTGGTLTLNGGANDSWLFKIGTGGTGALTGTGFTVVLGNRAEACNVTWWVAEAVTMTDSDFKGSVLAGTSTTITRGTFAGDDFSKAAATLTGAAITGCESGTAALPAPKQKCNQGVGNGPEGCDPGNSNQANPFRSNDERGGVPGKPGRTVLKR